MVECVVEYDYNAEEDDELSLKVGDIVHNVVKMDGGWWEGEINGKKGVFPDNFVKEKKVETRSKEGSGKKGNVEQLANQLKAANISNVPKRSDPVSKKTRAKVTYSYTPENNDEIELAVGDIVEILNQEEEGWWEGKLNGKTGVFPSNFVEIIEDEVEEPVAEPDPPKVKKVRGVGFGNIFEGGPIQLKKASNKHPVTEPPKPKEHKAPPKKAEPAPPPVPKEAPVAKPEPPKADQERAKVLFDYDAENEDELTLKTGQIIVVLNKQLEDSGWWKGEIGGKIGVFPDNFVELLPPEKKPSKPPPPLAPRKPEKDVPVPDTKPARPEEKTSKAAPPLPSKKPAPSVSAKPAYRHEETVHQTDEEKLKRDGQKEHNHVLPHPIKPSQGSNKPAVAGKSVRKPPPFSL